MSSDLKAFGHLIKHNPPLRRLWISNMISMLGDWLSYVAVSLISVKQGGSAVSVALVMVAHTLPLALMSPISGPLTDRFDRRRLLLWAYGVAGGVTVLMWMAAGTGSVGWVQALLVLRVLVSGLGMTARTAAIPSLVEPERLHVANALLGLSWSVLFAAGTALGGVLAALLGPSEAILLDALTFVLAAGVVWGLPALPPISQGEGVPSPRPGIRQMVEAWRFARPRPTLLVAVLAKSPMGAANAGVWVTMCLLAEVRLPGLGAAMALGLFNMLRAVGTGVGPLLPRTWIERVANRGTPLGLAGAVLFVLFDTPWVALPALVIWGMGSGHNWVSATAQMQAAAPGHILGRITAFDFLSFSGAQALMALLSGLMIDAVGAPTAGAWLGLSVGLIGWVILWSVARRSDQGLSPAT